MQKKAKIKKLNLNTKVVNILDDQSMDALKGGGTLIWNICPTSKTGQDTDTNPTVGTNTMPSVKGSVVYCQ